MVKKPKEKTALKDGTSFLKFGVRIGPLGSCDQKLPRLFSTISHAEGAQALLNEISNHEGIISESTGGAVNIVYYHQTEFAGETEQNQIAKDRLKERIENFLNLKEFDVVEARRLFEPAIEE